VIYIYTSVFNLSKLEKFHIAKNKFFSEALTEFKIKPFSLNLFFSPCYPSFSVTTKTVSWHHTDRGLRIIWSHHWLTTNFYFFIFTRYVLTIGEWVAHFFHTEVNCKNSLTQSVCLQNRALSSNSNQSLQGVYLLRWVHISSDKRKQSFFPVL